MIKKREEYILKEGIRVYKYVMPVIESNMYIYIHNNSKSAIIIDPHISEDAIRLIDDNEIRQIIILPTHEHYDHISGIVYLREKYDKCLSVICTEKCDINMKDSSKNFSKYWDILTMGFNKDVPNDEEYMVNYNYTCSSDIRFDGEYTFYWNKNLIRLISAPGHSEGGMLIDINGKMLCTGDNLTNGNGVIYRWPGGNKKDYINITRPLIESYNGNTVILPGHGDIGDLCDMKQYLDFYKNK